MVNATTTSPYALTDSNTTLEVLATLRAEVDGALRACLRELEDHDSLRRIPGLADTISEFITGGGQRIRPLLFLLAWRGYGGSLDEAILRVAAAIELFHSFALVHDDLVDHSVMRRGKPSLQVLLAQRLRVNEQTGQELALLAGDIVYSAAIRAILSAPAQAERKVRVLDELMRVAIDTGAGVCLEVTVRQQNPQEVRQETVDLVQNLKTSQYTFVCPLTLAAILSAAAPEEQIVLSHFGALVGRAYQMQDDLDDMRGYLADLTSLQSCEARHLWPFWQACQQASAPEREELNKAALALPAAADSIATIQRIFAEQGVFEQGEECIRRLLQRSEDALSPSVMSVEYKGVLWQSLRGFFRGAQIASEEC